jgi:ABC-type multidrug transport system ATPase subunit
LIRVEGLSVFFGRTVALDSVDLRLDRGVVGLFGPNASGKSTLLRVAAGLLRPSRGTFSFDGVAPTAFGEALRGQVGYVGHVSGLYAHLTLRENLLLLARLYGVEAGRADDVLDQLELTDQAPSPVGSLSAGYRRRAAVARALVHEPRLLLLDEPYANLDGDATALVSAAIKHWRRPDRIALVATHGAKELKRWADGGIVLRRGRVVVSGRYSREAAAATRTL